MKIKDIDNKTLHCSDGNLPRAYAFPKIHKIGSQYRIIVSYVDSPLYSLTAFVQDIIGQYVFKRQSHIDNSFMLVKKLNDKFINDGLALILLLHPCSPTFRWNWPSNIWGKNGNTLPIKLIFQKKSLS